MSIISAGDTGGLDLPEISNSLRFDGTNDYLARTYTSSATNTFSAWVKRSKLGAIQPILGSSVKFNVNDTITAFSLTTTAIFRDPSAWLHIHVSNGGLYVNGVSYGAVTTSALTNASIGYDGTNFFDGYIAYPLLIDGSSSAYSNVAYTDPNGQWRSLSKTALQSVVNAGGVNSFFLSFDNGSSTTTLGNDASSKGNNWTLTNMVRTGGVDDCWSYDTPTNNFATLNPLKANLPVAPSEGNLYVYGTTSAHQVVSSISFDIASESVYCEATSAASPQATLGIKAESEAITTTSSMLGYYQDGTKYVGTGSWSAYGSSYTSGDVIGIKAGGGSLEFFKNGVSQGVAFSGLTGRYMFMFYNAGSGTSGVYFNFGQRPVASGQWYPDAGGYFRYAPPTGYKALSTKNLPGGAVTTSGTFTGNVAAEGPFVWLNGTPTAMTINGNAVTFGTHADKLANGFKLRTASTSYNNSGSNTYSVTSNAGAFKYNNAEGNP